MGMIYGRERHDRLSPLFNLCRLIIKVLDGVNGGGQAHGICTLVDRLHEIDHWHYVEIFGLVVISGDGVENKRY